MAARRRGAGALALAVFGLVGGVLVAPAASAATLPSPPDSVSASPEDGGISVDWSSGSTVGGAPVTGFVVEWREGSGAWSGPLTVSATARSAHLAGLTNGGSYRACVYTVTGVGRSADCRSNSPSVVAGAPDRPVPSWTRLPNGQLRVSWDAVDGNGSPVTSYQLAVDGGPTPPIDVAAWDAAHPQQSGPEHYWYDLDLPQPTIDGHDSITLVAVDQYGPTYGENTLRTAAGDRMVGSDPLYLGDQLTSPNGRYSLRMQPDGNLVLYADGARPLWNTATWGDRYPDGSYHGAGYQLLLQGDGNLLLENSAGGLAWGAGTWNNPGARLLLQDDGNLVLYAADGHPIWSTGWDRGAGAPHDTLWATQELVTEQTLVSPNGRYTLRDQPDGNVVLYGPSGVSWATGTWTQGGYRFRMQTDGNLVLYTFAGQAVTSSRTQGNPGARVVLQDDGNLVVYAAGGRALWSSKFGRTY